MRFSMAPKSARAGANSLYGQMDLTGVISTLESHWVVLDAELSEIRKDFNSLKALTHKHGDFWSRPMAQLKKLRTQKENLLKEYAAAQPRVHAAARLRMRYSGLTRSRPCCAHTLTGLSSRWSSSTCTSSRAATCAQSFRASHRSSKPHQLSCSRSSPLRSSRRSWPTRRIRSAWPESLCNPASGTHGLLQAGRLTRSVVHSCLQMAREGVLPGSLHCMLRLMA